MAIRSQEGEWVQDLHLPLSPSKRPWWRITAKVREEERGHGEVHDGGEELLGATTLCLPSGNVVPKAPNKIQLGVIPSHIQNSYQSLYRISLLKKYHLIYCDFIFLNIKQLQCFII